MQDSATPNGQLPALSGVALKFIDDVLLCEALAIRPRPRLSPDKVIRWHVHTHDVGMRPTWQARRSGTRDGLYR